MKNSILELRNITKFYTDGNSAVIGIDGVSMSFSVGEFVAVTGESGSGKSTLANVLCGVLPYESGEMLYNGKPTSHFGAADWESYRKNAVSLISQNYGILPGASVVKNVESALVISGTDKRKAAADASEIIKKVGLWDMRRKRAAKLSSGQKQRLSIARALAKPSPVLVADEPTGNLDSANSRDVVKLLAKASEDRLVIIITHDFAEVSDLVSRHIVLKNGRVTSDIPLSKPHFSKLVPTHAADHTRRLGTYTAALEISSRPVWSFVVSLIFAMTAFAVFSFFGVFIVSIDKTPTFKYDSNIIPNGDRNRIIVSSFDGKDLSPDELERLLTIKHVSSIQKNDSTVDVKYGYRFGEDYIQVNNDHSYYDITTGEFHFIFYQTLASTDKSGFVRLLPLFPHVKEIICEGSEPRGFYEVAAPRGEVEIGDVIKVIFFPEMRGEDAYLALEMTVVGLTNDEDAEGALYFSDEIGEFLACACNNENMFLPSDIVKQGTYFCSPQTDDDVGTVKNFPIAEPDPSDGESPFLSLVCFGHGNPSVDGGPTYEDTAEMDTGAADTDTDTDTDTEQAEVNVELIDKLDGTDTLSNLYFVSPDDYALLVRKTHEYPQASLIIDDYAYTDRVLQAVQKLGYSANSPYRLGSVIPDKELAEEREQTLRVCGVSLLITAILQILLLVAMFSVETDSYRILSDLGLTVRDAKTSLLGQVIIFTALGQAAGAAAIAVCAYLGVTRIENMLRYLPQNHLLLLSGVHLLLSLIAFAFIQHGVGRRVYPVDTRSCDYKFMDDEKAV